MSGPDIPHGDGFDLPLPRRGVLSGKSPRTSRRWRLSFVRALKAKSPGSSPGNAIKIPNKINSLKVSMESLSFAFLVLVALCGTFVVAMRGMKPVVRQHSASAQNIFQQLQLLTEGL
jgi:hypothetical protein